MKRKRKSSIIFIRASLVTAVVLSCITAVFLGICESYEQIRRVSFGEERSAVEISLNGIRILDFEIKI